ncbi:hypothetical protein THIOM_004267 [Candidatus Thiomargarita nelsonii]|uniref:Uncharacterized protein n=1 Tax=Candidatus Thiomargarita nelsonii TaxID=1003181 RepID=A0A176RWB3_9GAMM|nr:hypothetical protein THIOM_004267 [Candidatus Thiomargarita nelsonii]
MVTPLNDNHHTQLSCPPCKLDIEVKTAAGLPTNAPESHKPLVCSKKYFKGAAILPKWVGLPSAKPAQFHHHRLLREHSIQNVTWC